MMYTRGHPEDFHHWYKDLNDYNYQRDILRYFKKAENQIGKYISDRKYHSRNGPLIANDLKYVSEMYKAVIAAASDMGYPIRDVNGEFSTGKFKFLSDLIY